MRRGIETLDDQRRRVLHLYQLAARVRELVLATDQMELLADALQLEIAASTDTAEIGGVIPTYSPLDEHRHHRSKVTN